MNGPRTPSVGWQIRRIRQDRDLVQKVVAIRAGIDGSRLAAFERGRRSLAPDVVARVLDALEVAPTLRQRLLVQLRVEQTVWSEDPNLNATIVAAILPAIVDVVSRVGPTPTQSNSAGRDKPEQLAA